MISTRSILTKSRCKVIRLCRSYALPSHVHPIRREHPNPQEKSNNDQKWSSRTLIALATLTGATTYIIALLQANSRLNKAKHTESLSPSGSSSSTHVQYGDPVDPATFASLRALFPDPDQISTDPIVLEAHERSDWSSHDPLNFHTPKSRGPAVVVYPRSTIEVQKLCKWATEHKIPLVPMSGGTSLEGQFSAPHGGVSVDMTRMDKILKFRPEDGDIDVQPGVSWEELRDVLDVQGWIFPPDPGPGAMIGGMIGTGCSGTNAMRWGTMKDWVLSITAVMADGQIVKTRQRPRKSSAGYDLTRLFIGSEGTLGIVTEATLKLAHKPEETSVAVCGFKSISQAAKTVADCFNAGIQLGAIEILDDVMMKIINQAGNASEIYDEVPTLFFKFSGSKTQVKEDIVRVQRIAKANLGTSFKFAKSQEDKEKLWEGRKLALFSIMGAYPGFNVWVTDVVVPISKLADCIVDTKKDIDDSGFVAPIVGHVGDGNYHTCILFNARDEMQSKKAQGVVDRMVYRALAAEGSCTGEHAVGSGKRHYLAKELGPGAVQMMRLIKKSVDPYNILNPGKLIPDE